MPVVDLMPATARWSCGDCATRLQTRATASIPLHECPGHAGFRLPMVPEGSGDRVVTVERDDYVGAEHVQYDGEGRPIMRAEVERADGHRDVWVYAPTAYTDGRAFDG